MIFFIFSNFSFLEISNLMVSSCFKKLLRLVVCKTSFYLLFYNEHACENIGCSSVESGDLLWSTVGKCDVREVALGAVDVLGSSDQVVPGLSRDPIPSLQLTLIRHKI